MKKSKQLLTVVLILIAFILISNILAAQTGSKPVQTKKKTTQTTQKPTQTRSKAPVQNAKTGSSGKPKDEGIVIIGTQSWAIANLNVNTFRNGDTIPEAKTNNDWVKAGQAGKPAWCYYNNDPANGPKFGRLYNWFAVIDPRGLAPDGWSLSNDEDWAKLAYTLGGTSAAGDKLKSSTGWSEGYNGTNASEFTGLPAGYRVENGLFQNAGSIGIWWSSTESKSLTAYDHYLSMSGSLSRSSNPKQRGESVRCIKR